VMRRHGRAAQRHFFFGRPAAAALKAI